MSGMQTAAQVRIQRGASRLIDVRCYRDDAGEWRATVKSAGNHEPMMVTSEGYDDLRDLLLALQLCLLVHCKFMPAVGAWVRVDDRLDVALWLEHNIAELPWQTR
jgi:hypothetical protein